MVHDHEMYKQIMEDGNKLNAGTAKNVIPPIAELTGTVRTFSKSVRAEMEERIRRLAENIASGYRCTAQVNYIQQVPIVNNDKTCVSYVSHLVQSLIGSDRLVETLPSMGGEDFTYYLEHIPGCFFWLGSGSLEKTEVYGLLSPHFVVNEDCIPLGVSIFTAFICYRLGGLEIGH